MTETDRDMIETQNNFSANLNETLAVTTMTSDAVGNVTHDATFLNVGYLSRILPSVVAMSILFVLSAVGNVTVFSTLVSSRLRKTRISTIILHLTISDLIVTFLVIPSEVKNYQTSIYSNDNFYDSAWLVGRRGLVDRALGSGDRN